MNNSQFRKLLIDQQSSPKNDASLTPPSTNASTSTFGARRSNFTPRAVKGGIDLDFARQVRERNAALNPQQSQPSTKKFKSSVPKGSRFLAGYTDRSKARQDKGVDAEEEDDIASRVTALEEQMKAGEISRELFEKLRDEITGGDVRNTHLVKGLDWRLLERVRRGEDVFKKGPERVEAEQGVEAEVDVDGELERLEEKEVEGVKKDKLAKKGSMAGRKRNRDEIMAELRAQRAEAKEAALAEERAAEEAARPKIEIDHKGREVIMIVGEDGRVKKKVRKIAPQAKTVEEQSTNVDASSTTATGKPSALAEKPGPVPEDDEDDIFAEAGTDYNPLGDQPEDDEDDDDDDDMDDDDQESNDKQRTTNLTKSADHSGSNDSEDEGELHEKPREAKSETTRPKRNYFNDQPSTADEDKVDQLAGLQNILKKAAKMDSTEDDDPEEAERKARLKKRAQMLAQADRDLEDMDMGFGGSRIEDEEDGGDAKVKLSKWKDGAEDGGDDDNAGGGKGGKKKRKPKKRKGDVNNIDDIMRVVESRKAAAGGK